MSLLMQNTVLNAAEQRIESQLDSVTKANFQKIVVAGMASAMQGGPNSIMASIQKSQNPVHDCAVGAVGLCLMMRKQAKGVMPIKSMVPAGMVLMLHALDFAQKVGMIQVTNDVVAQASQIYVEALFKALHITPQMLQGLTTKAHAAIQNPQMMAQMHKQVLLNVTPEHLDMLSRGGR